MDNEKFLNRVITLRYRDLLAMRDPQFLEFMILFYQLNGAGQMRMLEILDDLSQIPKYQKSSVSND